MRQQHLQQIYQTAGEPFVIAGVGWQFPLWKDASKTRECTDAAVLGLSAVRVVGMITSSNSSHAIAFVFELWLYLVLACLVCWPSF